MTRDEISAIILAALQDIAPECDPATLTPDVNLRDQLDLDSMDFQSFIIRLHEVLKVDVPERDYPQFVTINSAADYLFGRVGK